MVDVTLTQHLAWMRQRNLSDGYITTRRRAITAFEREVGTSALDATESAILGWHETLVARVTPEGRAVAISHVQCYYRWLIRQKYLLVDPTVSLQRPRTKRRLPRPMSDGDLEVALATARGHTRTWLLLAAYQGLRAIEIAHLRADDVDLDNDVLMVCHGKGGKQRLLPLHPAVRVELEPLCSRRSYLFDHYSGVGPPKPHNVSHAINHHLHGLGIRMTAHTCRHWFLTNVYRQSLDLRLTQELAGHSSPATTAGYAAWTPEKAAEIVNRLAIGHSL